MLIVTLQATRRKRQGTRWVGVHATHHTCSTHQFSCHAVVFHRSWWCACSDQHDGCNGPRVLGSQHVRVHGALWEDVREFSQNQSTMLSWKFDADAVSCTHASARDHVLGPSGTQASCRVGLSSSLASHICMPSMGRMHEPIDSVACGSPASCPHLFDAHALDTRLAWPNWPRQPARADHCQWAAAAVGRCITCSLRAAAAPCHSVPTGGAEMTRLHLLLLLGGVLGCLLPQHATAGAWLTACSVLLHTCDTISATPSRCRPRKRMHAAACVHAAGWQRCLSAACTDVLQAPPMAIQRPWSAGACARQRQAGACPHSFDQVGEASPLRAHTKSAAACLCLPSTTTCSSGSGSSGGSSNSSSSGAAGPAEGSGPSRAFWNP